MPFLHVFKKLPSLFVCIERERTLVGFGVNEGCFTSIIAASSYANP